MTPADYLIVAVCVASALVGVWRGFAREALSLLTLLIAIWLAWRFASVIEPYFGAWAGAPDVRVWAARVAVFIVVLIIGGVITWLARTLIRHSGLSGLDRLLGAAFGVVRAGVLIGLAALVLDFAGLDQDPWWRDARFKPYADRIAAAVLYYAELGNRYLSEQQPV